MKVIQNLRKELKKNINIDYKLSNYRFFKEPIKLYGVRTPIVRQIAKETYKSKIKATPSNSPLVRGRGRAPQDLSKTELFEVCEQLMSSKMQEEFTIASSWAFKRRKEFALSDFKIFESWVKKYISNWATCDDFCSKSLGYLLLDFPTLVPKVKSWTGSKNQWLRRASAVSLIISVRHSGSSNNHPSPSLPWSFGSAGPPLLGKGGGSNRNLDDIFDVSLKLMNDPEDLVQKAYGWALKEASNIYPKQVFNFVMQHKSKMTRTALRYAIEKMPITWKKKAMK